MTNVQEWNKEKWMERKLDEQRRLYDLYGRSLEKEHTGEFVAISLDGEIILGRREGAKCALDTFGRDNFVMARTQGDGGMAIVVINDPFPYIRIRIVIRGWERCSSTIGHRVYR